MFLNKATRRCEYLRLRLGAALPGVREFLFCEEDDADRDEDDGEPAAVVYVFAQEDLCGGGVADEGERGGGGGGEREVDDGEGVEHGEKVERHAEGAGEEEGAGEDGADGAKEAEEAGAGAEVVEVAEAAHGGGDEDFAGDGESGDGEDGAPLSEDVGVEEGGQRPAPESMRSRLGWMEGWAGSECSVREGPPATKPTAQTMRRMPVQR